MICKDWVKGKEVGDSELFACTLLGQSWVKVDLVAHIKLAHIGTLVI